MSKREGEERKEGGKKEGRRREKRKEGVEGSIGMKKWRE